MKSYLLAVAAILASSSILFAQQKDAAPEKVVYDEKKDGDFGQAKYTDKPAVRMTERGVYVIKGHGIDNVDDVDAFVFEVAGGKEFDFSLIAEAAEFKKLRSIDAEGKVKEVAFGSSNPSFRRPRNIYEKGLPPGKYHVEMYFGPSGASGPWTVKIAVRNEGESPRADLHQEPKRLTSAEKVKGIDWPGAVSIYVGHNWGKDEKFPIALKELGYGATGASEGQIKECEAAGLRAYVFIWAHEAGTIPVKYKDDKTVLCYYCSDRIKPSQWNRWEAIENAAYAGDPRHPAMFTMASDFGGMDLFCNAVKGRAMEYYHYDWDAKRRPAYRYLFLEQLRDESVKNGDVPVCRIIEVRPEDMRKTRHTMFTSLAYGVRGFRMGGAIFDLKNRDDRGVPKPNKYGDEIKKLNAAINGSAPIFVDNRCVAVYHTAPLPPGCKAPTTDSWINIEGPETFVGVFKAKNNDAKAPTYLLVANRDAFAAKKAKLTMTGMSTAERLDWATGRWNKMDVAKVDKGIQIEVPLDEGSGAMLKVVPR